MSDARWLVKQTEAAALFGVSQSTVAAWVRHGCPVAERTPTGRVSRMHLGEMIPWKLAQQQNRDKDPVAERARRDSEAADKLALENARTRGELLHAPTIAAEWVALITEAKTRMLALPSKLAPLVSGCETEEARGIIEEAIHDALRGLAADAYGDPDGVDATAETDGQPVGGHDPEAKPRVERRAGTVEH